MKKRVMSTLCSLLVLCSMVLSVSVNASAEEADNTGVIVDGSLLTYDDSSIGTTSNPMLRGKHLMDGESGISKAGNGKIYVYGETTADHVVDYIAVIMHVERLDEESLEEEGEEQWIEIVNPPYLVQEHDKYYVIVDDTLKNVERGYYYRVRCDHIAGNDDDLPYDEAFSVTNGIKIP